MDEYDSAARWYYPAIMRTTTIDPLAEKYYSISPYAWCGNNPVRNIDPDGMDVWTTNNPEEIIAFVNAVNSGANTFQTNGRWTRFSDDDFRAGLSMDTKKGGFHYTYGKVENGEFYIISQYFPEMRALNNPDSHFDNITGKYNLYTQNEIDKTMKFYLSTALAVGGGAVVANIDRAVVAYKAINATVETVQVAQKAVQTANIVTNVVQTAGTKTILGSIGAGIIEGGINYFLPPDASANFINTPFANGFSSITYSVLNLPTLLRTNSNTPNNETKK